MAQLSQLLLLLLTTCVSTQNLMDYLESRLNYINQQLDEHGIFPQEIKSNLTFHKSKTIHMPDKYERGHTFTLFNTSYLLLDYELFYVSFDEDKFTLLPHSNFVKFTGKIAFIKATNYNNISFTFVNFDTGLSHIYLYQNITNPGIFVQAIRSYNEVSDAKFFVNDGNLYLVVSSRMGSSLSPLVIYKWEGSHFDEKTKVLLIGAKSISTFSNFDSEVIVVLKDNPSQKSNTFIYEFNSDKLRKIQVLDNAKPTEMTTIYTKDNIYLILFDEVGYNTLYWWDGYEFITFQNFEKTLGVQKVSVEIVNDVPLIWAAEKERIIFYTVQKSTIQMVATYNITENLSNVFSIVYFYQNATNNLILMGFQGFLPTLIKLPFNFSTTAVEKDYGTEDEFLQCIQDLETVLKKDEESNLDRKEKIAEESKNLTLEATSLNNNDKILIDKQNNETVLIFKKTEKPQSESLVNRSSILGQSFENILPEQIPFPDIDAQITATENLLGQLQPHFANLLNEIDTIVNGKLIVQNAVDVQKLEADNLHVKFLNDIVWNPDNWLSYTKDQNIPAPFTIENLILEELFVNEDDSLVKDSLLLSNETQEIQGANLITLKCKNINTDLINDVFIKDLYLQSHPVIILGNKSIFNIAANNVLVNKLNGKNASDIIRLFGDPKAMKYEFSPNLKIKNLNVTNIDGINWNQFANSIFRIGSSQTIDGNLLFVKDLKTVNLNAAFIEEIGTENLLTTSTNQTVNSVIHFGNVDAENIVSFQINGLNFEDVVTFKKGKEMLINGPVTMKIVEIEGDLHINGSVKEFLRNNHVVGTREEDLLQIYNNTVKINGNLHLENVNLADAARLFINGNEFNQGNFNDYWLKTTNQEIPIHFEAHQGISTPHLNTKFLNNLPIDDYMQNNLDDKLPTNYVFENVTILGNVFINKSLNHEPNLFKLQEESVKLTGTYVVRGSKSFRGKLTVNHLRANSINSVPTDNFITKSSKEILGNKVFEEIHVLEDVVTTNLHTKQINGKDFNQIEQDAVYIDDSAFFQKLDFNNVAVRNLTTINVNSKPFNQYIISIDEIYLMDHLNKLTIDGGVVIDNVRNLSKVNNIDIAERMQNSKNPIITGDKIFEGKVFVKNLLVKTVNDVDFEELLMHKLYYRFWPQNITARHTFKVLTAPNIFTPAINNLNVEFLVDTKAKKPQLLRISKGIQIFNPNFLNSAYGNFNECDINKAANSIRDIPSAYWRSVRVTHNVTLMDDKCGLGVLLHKTVNKNKDNYITAPVTFSNIFAENLVATQFINGINLTDIIVDMVFINSQEEQVITGSKIFSRVSASNAAVVGNILINYINDIDIVKLNNTILYQNDLGVSKIKGHKTLFSGADIKNFEANFSDASNLVSLDNLKSIPKVHFTNLEISNDLNLGFVNYQNFTDFLKNRFLVNSNDDQVLSGYYSADDIELQYLTDIPQINDIFLSDVVFDIEKQVINAPKKYLGNLFISGEATTDQINGFDLNEIYWNSIMLDSPSEITANIRLENASQILGQIETNYINGFPVDAIKDILHSKKPQTRAEIVQDKITTIENLINENSRMIQELPDQYLYLEKATNFQISDITKTVDAQIVNRGDGIMMHIKTVEEGNHCGLSPFCVCPNQKTYWITSQNQVMAILGKSFQRVFTYDDDEVSMHLTTNSKSSSHRCRTNDSAIHEFTTLSWSTPSTAQRNGSTYIFHDKLKGYISDVKFFKHDNHIYIIISRFYNPITDNHNINCLVLRVSKEKDKIEDTQELPCQGAWSLHVFHTAQGINLIISNKGAWNNNHGKLSTDIYRFKPDIKKFIPLKHIYGSECVSATSVVLDDDSLIVLAFTNSPMQILKYNPAYDNYYLYQNFISETPIISVSNFYTGGVSSKDAYITAVTKSGYYYVYSYHYLAGWKTESNGEIEGLKALVPFSLNKDQYLFAASKNKSIILAIEKHGYN